MTRLGLLFVFCESPIAFNDELNDWYDHEHIPERLAIPGFLSALRFTSDARPHRYLALYDLERHSVLESPGYAAFSGDNNTPWTRRAMARATFIRLTAVQSVPGNARTGAASRLLVLRFRSMPHHLVASIGSALTESFAGRPNILQWRIFECQDESAGDRIITVEGHGDLEGQLSLPAFGAATRHLSLAETFRPY